MLEKSDFFSGLDRKLLDKVAESALLRTYSRGEAIIRQGDIGLGLYAILSGTVKVEREHDGVLRDLATLGPHEFFSEISLIDTKPRPATVTTVEETECLLLTRDTFLNLAQSYPDLALRLARVLAERLRAADDMLAEHGYGWRVTPSMASEPVQPGGFSKASVQSSMLDTFRSLYAMKALVRFSVAVLGCPVEGAAPNIVDQIRVGDAKAILLPAGEEVAMDILASENGAFTLHVFNPGVESPLGYGPLTIDPADRFQLRMAGHSVALWKADRMVAPSAVGV